MSHSFSNSDLNLFLFLLLEYNFLSVWAYKKKKGICFQVVLWFSVENTKIAG